jgi:polysaccharide pyruvyl transferase WcaK-like protein
MSPLSEPQIFSQQHPPINLYVRGCYNSTNLGDDLLLFGLLDTLHRSVGLQSENTTVWIDPQQDSIPALNYPLPFELHAFHEPLKDWSRTLASWHLNGFVRKLFLMLGIVYFTCVYGIYSLIKLPVGAFKTIDFFKKLTVLHYIGGGYFNTRLGFGTDLLVYEYLMVTFIHWVNPQAKIVASGLGIGPVTSSFYAWLFKRFLKNFSFVYVREKESLAFVKKLAPTVECQCLGDDATLLLPACHETLFPIQKKNLFAINLKYDDVHDYRAMGEKLEAIVNHVKAQGFEVAFFSFGADHKAISHLPASLQNSFPVYNAYEMGLMPFLKHLAQARYGLGFAYHFAILGTMLNIKTANIYYDDYYKQKTGGVIDQICDKPLTLSYEALMALPVESLLATLDATDANYLPVMVDRLSTTYAWAYQQFVLKPLN